MGHDEQLRDAATGFEEELRWSCGATGHVRRRHTETHLFVVLGPNAPSQAAHEAEAARSTQRVQGCEPIRGCQSKPKIQKVFLREIPFGVSCIYCICCTNQQGATLARSDSDVSRISEVREVFSEGGRVWWRICYQKADSGACSRGRRSVWHGIFLARSVWIGKIPARAF